MLSQTAHSERQKRSHKGKKEKPRPCGQHAILVGKSSLNGQPAPPSAPLFSFESINVTSLYLSFFICKMGIIMISNICRDYSVQFSHSVMSDSLRPHESQHARPPCPSQLPEFTQTHAHQVGDAIQPSHPLSSPSPLALNPSQHQGLFQ